MLHRSLRKIQKKAINIIQTPSLEVIERGPNVYFITKGSCYSTKRTLPLIDANERLSYASFSQDVLVSKLFDNGT